jgi:uncharacterized protein (TIGR01777 family)
MKVAISGASGFVGSYLSNYLSKEGYEIVAISKDDYQDIDILSSKVLESDIVLNLAGANIMQRWSEEYRKILYGSRIDTTKKIVKIINQSDKDIYLISTSAIGIYEDNIEQDEDNFTYANSFLSKICQDWESEARESKGKVAIFRFGVILGIGGALKKMLTPFKLGVGGKIADGRQPFSYIHIEDLARAYEFAIKYRLEGTFNLVTPHPVTNSIFTKALGKILNRPTIIPLPETILKLIFGEGATILTNGQRVLPKRLLNSGFKFKYGHIDDILKDLLS